MQAKKRRVPYGVINWERLVRECHFVDNTAYIRTLEQVETPIFLRPKRFGKSVVCSMLAYYYDINQKDRFTELFGKTDIGREPTEAHNAYLVLSFDFSTITVASLAEIERNFTENVRGSVRSFAAAYATLGDWSEAIAAPDAATMIDRLREVVASNRLPPICVIIDEYDNFTNELVVSNRDADYDAICGHDNSGTVRESYFKTFFKSFKAGLKDATVARTYFTGVLPITLDDLSSGFNVGTVVSLRSDLLGLVGFTEKQVVRYVDEIFAEHELDPALKSTVLSDLKRLYDGYRFLPDSTPLYNATICNWYLATLVAEHKIPMLVIDANVRTDIGWFRRLAQTPANAREKVTAYVERGEGESADAGALSAKFGRAKFFTDDFYPYALYYLGLLTFENRFRLKVPNLTVKNMFVDYYDELSAFGNVDEARQHFVGACEELCLNRGTWENVFEQYWQYYVKARIPAQAFDKMNENFFRTTFTSRCLDVMPDFFSFETEYNTPEGRCDFLAVPRPNVKKNALLIEFKYYTKKELLAKDGRRTKSQAKTKVKPKVKPDPQTLAQARAYRDAMLKNPSWDGPAEMDIVIVEICSSRGYNWIPVKTT